MHTLFFYKEIYHVLDRKKTDQVFTDFYNFLTPSMGNHISFAYIVSSYKRFLMQPVSGYRHAIYHLFNRSNQPSHLNLIIINFKIHSRLRSTFLYLLLISFNLTLEAALKGFCSFSFEKIFY